MTRVSRRTFLAGAAALGVATSLGGCRGSSGGTSGARRLRVLNWADYIDDATVDLFRAATGAEVDYVAEYEGNEDAFATLFRPTLGAGKATGYDVIVPTYWAVDRLLAEQWLHPLPLERIPNHVNVDPAFLGMPWDRGARFHMPWQVGITGIAYNPALTTREVRSMADLLDRSLRGRVGMVAEMRETVGLLMLAAGADPSRATEPAAQAALDRLEQLVADGHVIAFTGNEFVDALQSGEFAACLAWSGDIIQLQAERPDIRFEIPVEGGIRWFDSMIIPVGADRPDLAGDWMNFVYAPEHAARITTAVQYISPVLGVREELDGQGGEGSLLAANPILFPDDETRRRLYVWSGLDAEAEDRIQARFSDITGA